MLCGFTTLNGRTRSHHACSALGRVLTLYSSDIVYRIQKTPQSKPRVIYHDWLHLYNGEAEPTCLPSLWGKSSEASVGEKSLPPPPGISGSKSAGSKKRNMMTSGSPSTKGGGGAGYSRSGPPVECPVLQGNGPQAQRLKDWLTARFRSSPSWARDYCLDV